MAINSDLTQGPLWRKFRALAIPGAIGMLFTTLYNIVDIYFAGMISTASQAGLAVSFQPFFLLLAFGIGLSIAMSALVGNAVGAGDQAHTRCLAFQGVTIAVLGSGILILLGWVITPHILQFTSEPGAYRTAGLRYFNLLLIALPGFVFAFTFNGTLQALGDAVSMQRALMVSFFANIALNPVLMFGIPNLWDGMGFDGIAVSTILCQTGVAAFMCWRLFTNPFFLQPRLKEFRLTGDCMREIFVQFVPSSSSMIVLIFAGLFVQSFLKEFGQEAIAAYGIGLRIEQLFLLPVLGLTGSLLPIAAQNFGAQKIDRVRRAFWVCIAIGLGYMAIACPILWLASPYIMALFDDTKEVIDIGVGYLRIDGLILPVYMALFAINSFLQALKLSSWTFWVGVYRQLIAVPAFVYLFIKVFGFPVMGVWLGIASAVLTGLLVSGAFAYIAANRVLKIGKPEEVVKSAEQH